MAASKTTKAGTKTSRTAFILGLTADIGLALTERLLRDGWHVIGTGRAKTPPTQFKKVPRLTYIPYDPNQHNASARLIKAFKKQGTQWDLFISMVGTMEPIGKFFDLDFDSWETSVIVNSTAQLRVLHAVWPYRRKDKIVDVMLTAGGGTNNPFTNYSAYCISKIALIKMTELLDDEEKKLNIFIIGPGFVRTRIHKETLKAGKKAGAGYAKTKDWLKTNPGASMDDIYNHMQWCMKQGRDVSGGRNFATQHDPWQKGISLAKQLRGDKDAYRLRRAAVQPEQRRV